MADDGFRDRMSKQGEEALGKLASDLLENPLINSAITRAFSAREKAVQAQEAAMGALNLPSAADIDRLTRRLRTVSTRLEGIEESLDRLQDGVDRLSAKLGSDAALVERLNALEGQLSKLTHDVSHVSDAIDAVPPARPARAGAAGRRCGTERNRLASARQRRRSPNKVRGSWPPSRLRRWAPSRRRSFTRPRPPTIAKRSSSCNPATRCGLPQGSTRMACRCGSSPGRPANRRHLRTGSGRGSNVRRAPRAQHREHRRLAAPGDSQPRARRRQPARRRGQGGGPIRFAHHITLENLVIRGHGNNQQTVGISTKCPAWNWVIRGNTIVGAGTGCTWATPTERAVRRRADRAQPDRRFDRIQPADQASARAARPPGMPAGRSITIIRHNVFAKPNARRRERAAQRAGRPFPAKAAAPKTTTRSTATSSIRIRTRRCSRARATSRSTQCVRQRVRRWRSASSRTTTFRADRHRLQHRRGERHRHLGDAEGRRAPLPARGKRECRLCRSAGCRRGCVPQIRLAR